MLGSIVPQALALLAGLDWSERGHLGRGGGAWLWVLQWLVSVCPLQELVEYYQCHSLKESFKQLDTTLKFPYKSRERAATRASSRSPGNACAQGYLAQATSRAEILPVHRHVGQELLRSSHFA